MPNYIHFDTQTAAVIGTSIAADDACRLMYITGGEGKIVTEEKTLAFSKRDIFVLPKKTRLEAISQGGYTRIMIRIDSDLADQFKRFVKVHDNQKQDVFTLIKMLERECGSDIPSHSEYISRLAQVVFSLVYALSKHDVSHTYIERIESMIEHNLPNATFELDSIYTLAPDLTKDYVRRIFKQKTGLTPNAYLNRLRIEKAKKLLSKTSDKMSIKQIADSCGFNDQYYFSRTFKRAEGVSPAHWKKQNTT